MKTHNIAWITLLILIGFSLAAVSAVENAPAAAEEAEAEDWRPPIGPAYWKDPPATEEECLADVRKYFEEKSYEWVIAAGKYYVENYPAAAARPEVEYKLAVSELEQYQWDAVFARLAYVMMGHPASPFALDAAELYLGLATAAGRGYYGYLTEEAFLTYHGYEFPSSERELQELREKLRREALREAERTFLRHMEDLGGEERLAVADRLVHNHLLVMDTLFLKPRGGREEFADREAFLNSVGIKEMSREMRAAVAFYEAALSGRLYPVSKAGWEGLSPAEKKRRRAEYRLAEANRRWHSLVREYPDTEAALSARLAVAHYLADFYNEPEKAAAAFEEIASGVESENFADYLRDVADGIRRPSLAIKEVENDPWGETALRIVIYAKEYDAVTATLYAVDPAKYELLERELHTVDLYLDDGRRVRPDLARGQTGFEEVDKSYAEIVRVEPRPTAELPGVGEAVTSWEVATGYAGDLRFVACEATCDDLAPGVYVVEARAPDGNLCRSLFVHTKVAAVTVDEELETYVQVSDTEAGHPVEVTRFEGYTLPRRLETGTIVGERWAPVEVGARPSGEGYLVNRGGIEEGEILHVVCHTDLGPAFVELRRPWIRGDVRSERGVIYTDKPLYRPGNKVNYKCFFRLADPLERALTPIVDTKIELQVTDPRGETVWRGEGVTDEFGTAWGSFDLSEEVRLGLYSVSAAWESPLRRRRTETGARFSVEEYEKPEYEVVLAPEKDRYLSGEKIRLKVAGSYFFGGAMAEATVAYEITRSGPERRGYEHDVLVKKGEGTTDVAGEYVIEWRSQYAGKYDNNYTIHVKLTDPSRGEIRETARVRTFVSDRFVDFSTDKYDYHAGEPVKVKLRTFDWYKKPVAAPVRLKVYEYKQKRRGRDYEKGRKLYDASVVTNEEGKAEVSVALADPPAVVVFEAEVRSTAGAKYTANLNLRFVPPEAETAERVPEIEIAASDRTPELGEAVEITVRSRFEGVNVGVLQFVNEIEEFRNLSLARDPEGGYKTSFTILAAERHFPELKLLAALFHDGRFYTSGETVRPRDRATEMAVTVEPEKEEYVPSDGAATVTVSTAAPGGGPVVANLSLVAVDEALLALRPDETSYIPEGFPELLRYYVSCDVEDTLAAGGRQSTAPYQYHFYRKVSPFRGTEAEFIDIRRTLRLAELPEVYDYTGTGFRTFPNYDRLNPRFYASTLLRWGGIPAETTGISGRVFDQNNQPVSGVLVVVAGTDRFATTNADGEYLIEPVSPGYYDVAASRIGFNEEVKGGILVEDGYRTVVDFYLRSEATGATYIQSEEPLIKFNQVYSESIVGKEQFEGLADDGYAMGRIRTPGIVYEDEEGAPSSLNLHIRGGRGGEEVALAKAVLREGFVDLAFWEPALITDERGEVTAEIELPDNLTTWTLMALAVDRGSRVGWGGGEFNVTKHVIARLKAPRHLVVGDICQIRTIGHNYLGEAREMTFITATEDLELVGGEAERRAEVEAGEHGFSSAWYRAVRAGEARLEGFAGTAVESDALALEIPVISRGTVIRHAFAGRLRDSVVHDLAVVGDVDADTFEGEVIASASLAKTLSHGLDYYREYPYNCLEQTLNRFLVNALLAEAAAELGLDESALSEDLDEALAMGLQAMAKQQESSGGWPWLPGGKASPYMTAYALDGLYALEDSPFLGVEERGEVKRMIRDGSRYLVDFLEELEEAPERHDAELSLYVADVALRRGLVGADYAPVRETFDYHFEWRNPRSDRGLVLLGSVAHHLGEEEKVGTVLRNLDNVVRVGPDRTLWWGEAPDRCWRWWGDAVETTAAVLEFKMLAEPESEQIPHLVDWLVDQRRGSVWKSTKDSAEATKALIHYLLAYPEASKPIVLTYALNDAAGGLAVDPLRFENPDERAELAWEHFKAGDNTFSLERYSGEGPVFYAVAVEYYTEAEYIPAVQGSVTLDRTYYLIERYKKAGKMEERRRPLDRPLKPGEEVEVEIRITSPYDFDFVVLEDPRPAGCVNVETASAFNWYIDGYVELKNDKRAVLFERLRRGETKFSYRLRAEVPGEYVALPARVYGMYSPDIGSSTASAVVEIAE